MYLAEKYNNPWFPVWFIAVHTGARSGELYALEWSDIDLGERRIFLNKSFNKSTNSIGPTKGGYWREVPINNELLSFLRKQKLKLADSKYVLPRIVDWDRSAQAKVLRNFLTQIGLPSIKFHALRACFATHLLRNGVSVVTVMKIGGWKDMATMQRYVRLAGIEVQGASDSLSFLSPDEMMGKITELYR